LLVVSKGLVESRNGSKEFGLERVREGLETMEFQDANQLTSGILDAVQRFTKNTAGQNDITALSIMRSAKATLAAAGSA
jgi:serine phosphatase RsbU (regulator of sigma subunit)